MTAFPHMEVLEDFGQDGFVGVYVMLRSEKSPICTCILYLAGLEERELGLGSVLLISEPSARIWLG